jgi:hypothetical protein
MHDAFLDLLWLLALRLAGEREVRLDLSTWPATYLPHVKA